MTKEEVKRILTVVSLTWQMFDASKPGLVDLWHRIVGELSYDECSRVLESIILEGDRFPPTPGQVARAWRDSKVQNISAAEGIDLVNKRLRLWRPPAHKIQHHPTRSEVERLLHDQPLLCIALFAVGVERWRDTAEENRSFLYSDFKRHYEELIESAESREKKLVSDAGLPRFIDNLRSNLATLEDVRIKRPATIYELD